MVYLSFTLLNFLGENEDVKLIIKALLNKINEPNVIAEKENTLKMLDESVMI